MDLNSYSYNQCLATNLYQLDNINHIINVNKSRLLGTMSNTEYKQQQNTINNGILPEQSMTCLNLCKKRKENELKYFNRNNSKVKTINFIKINTSYDLCIKKCSLITPKKQNKLKHKIKLKSKTNLSASIVSNGMVNSSKSSVEVPEDDGLTKDDIDTIKQSQKAISDKSQEIMTVFYKNLLTDDSPVLELFNMTNQRNKIQIVALSDIIKNVVNNIDTLEKIQPMFENIHNKHCGLNIKKEHYPLIGKILVESTAEVFKDDLTPKLSKVWSKAVNFLAGVFIKAEEALQEKRKLRQGGWYGAKEFELVEKKEITKDVTTFGWKSPGIKNIEFDATQQLTIKLPDCTPRHQTITSKSGEDILKHSTKKLDNALVSNKLHNLKIGDKALLSPPFGLGIKNFNPDNKNVVSISAGIGITPLRSILENTDIKVIKCLHVDKNKSSFPFYEQVKEKTGSITAYYGKPPSKSIEEMFAKLFKDVGKEKKFICCAPPSFTKIVREIEYKNKLDITYLDFTPRVKKSGNKSED